MTTTVIEILSDAASTYRERNAVYGNNYHAHGPVMQALFPEGLALNSAADHARFGVLTQVVAKLTRYAMAFKDEGHVDSAHDLCVYAAMLEELTRAQRSTKDSI